MKNILLIIAFVIVFFSGVILSVEAEPKPGCIPGAYLVQEASGTQSLWTFSKDGTVQSASSAQGPLNFSQAHGVWKQIKTRQVQLTMLDFTYDSSPPPSIVARVDATFTFSKKCGEIQGSFELRFFTPGSEDALDPSTDTGSPISDTITGRRINAR